MGRIVKNKDPGNRLASENMMNKKPPIALYIVLGLALAGLAVLGYGYASVRGERAAIEEKAGDLEKKIALLDRKYSEKRALEQQLVRARVQVEGQLRGLQSEMEKLRSEKDLLLEEKSKTQMELEKVKARAASLEASQKEIKDTAEKLQAESEAHAKAQAKALKDQQQETERLLAERRQAEAELQSALKATQQKLERSESHNARLAVIAEELTEKYKNKGVTTSILQAEPFTQIEKVEMENLLAEYRERIEDEKLKKSTAKKP
jgi:chromosome segregation ATPase